MGGIGTGKTRMLIDLANNSAKNNDGNIIYIDNNRDHMYELSHKVRFIETSEFEINSLCCFNGFICGIISKDFDISQIYIDGIFQIANDSIDSLEEFLNNITALSKKFGIEFVVTLTGEPKAAPEFLKKYIA
jgi:uncharacterized metal-binding protein